MNVCLLAGVLYTLAWTHSVEKVTWEEDWQAAKGRLVLVEARIQGSGAGMEPGEDAVLKNGFWRWRPKIPPLDRLILTQSYYATDYRLCWFGECHAMSELAPDAPTVELTACP
ncbi:MAG: DUF1850 domain-containing protein [Alphaproteobacteria bacterium]|nr:DUF1850 domain-containing protein [Alphaproteobacteria bacterium]